MNIVYAPRALRDIDDILAYIQQRSPTAARTVSFAIERAVELSAQVPLTGGKTHSSAFKVLPPPTKK